MAQRNDEKLRELILYLALKSEGDESFGAIKLNKLLFYIDFMAFRDLGHSVTGEEYQHLELGPAPRGLKPTLETLKAEGSAAEQQRKVHGYPQRRVFALREPVLSLFTGDEIALVDHVLESMRHMNATEASELTHHFIGWEVTDMYETIPYETVFIDRRPVTANEEAYMEQLVREGRLSVPAQPDARV